MTQARYNDFGYVCPVRGCDKKKNRRFGIMGLCMHIVIKHGEAELVKRLKCKIMGREVS